MNILLEAGIIVAGLMLAVFILLYLQVRWWRNWYGITIMSMKVSVLGLAFGALYRVRGHDIANIVLTVSWWLVAVVMLVRIMMLWRDQAEYRRHLIARRNLIAANKMVKVEKDEKEVGNG